MAQQGEYEVILNTDSEYYWGSNYPVGEYLPAFPAAAFGLDYMVQLDLPPLSTLYLRRKTS